jgi:CheY-like chemotaxis protein
MPPGRYSALSISDTGKGMSGEVREKVFEPFFTTKEEGKGTGLGLATVYGIVKQHDGHIALDTAEGEGTTFTIYFPVTEEIAEQTLTEEQSERLGGTETILAVDSDDSIRMIIGETLQSLGYTLLSAASGEEAVRIRESVKNGVTLLLTEVMMPGMNGRELAEIFARRWPETRILLMSGYTGDALDDSFFEENSARFLDKPITPRKLAAAVRGALDSPPDR